MKFPWLKFYPGDWLKEPSLTVCSPATRGIWIDLICIMHESGRVGEVSGTVEQLAKLARCSAAEMAALEAGRAAAMKSIEIQMAEASKEFDAAHLAACADIFTV